jgi:choline dehydrogenase-like flavoprotein
VNSLLERHYDVVVCGAGSSGSVIARRVAENPDVKVLLLEAGGTDEVPGVTEASQWPLNLGGERDWVLPPTLTRGFMGAPSRSRWAKCWAAGQASI